MEKCHIAETVLIFAWILIYGQASTQADLGVSCEYERMTEFLLQLSANYSSLVRLVSIGKSVEDREIWAVIVSDSPHNRPLLRPQVKFVGNVNGMSGPACYVLLRLIKQLVQEYGNEASMERKLMESTEMHIIPNLNPDGYARAESGSCNGKEGRHNANDVNLNTNFPDVLNENIGPPIQPETHAIMNWIENNQFVVSVSVISGARVVVYPFDSIIVEHLEHFPEGAPHFTPDDDIFKHLALTYAKKTGAPEEGWYCPVLQRTFPQGIINGAEWKAQSGTMMDFNYFQGTFEIMVGISCCRNEDNETALDDLWWKNREGLLHVANEVDNGIRGQVLDSETYHSIHRAKLTKKSLDYFVEDNNINLPWFTSVHGEFWRPWRPGIYILNVEKEGYKPKDVKVEVKHKGATFISVELEKLETTTVRHTSTPQPTKKNESIKKITTFSTIKDNGFFEYFTSTETTNEELKPEITPLKHYSSLTQLDHSFINLFKGIQLRSSAWDQGQNLMHVTVTVSLLCRFLIYLQLAGN